MAARMSTAATARNGAEGAARAFGAYLRARRKAAQLTLRELADLAQISNPYLSQIERGLHQPSVAVIRSLADALNLSADVLFAEAAGLQRVAAGADAAPVDVETAIWADQRLTPAQMAALLAVYRSMVDSK
jgi:transcriptional regulator with XRE-family HTH domain